MKMRNVIMVHVVLFVLIVGLLYALGMVDMSRLNQADAEHRVELILGHVNGVCLDGGSTFYESIIYSAFESRKLVPCYDENGETYAAAVGYQGFTWKWKHYNVLWIVAVLALSCMDWARRARSRVQFGSTVSNGPLIYTAVVTALIGAMTSTSVSELLSVIIKFGIIMIPLAAILLVVIRRARRRGRRYSTPFAIGCGIAVGIAANFVAEGALWMASLVIGR